MPQGLTIEKVRKLRPKIALMPPEDQRDMFSYAWNILILPKLDTKHLSQDDLDTSQEQYVTAMMGAVPTKLPESYGRPKEELTPGQKLMAHPFPVIRGLSRSVEGGITALERVQQFQRKYLGLEDPEFARAERLREGMKPVSEAMGEPGLAGKAMQLVGETALPGLIAAPFAMSAAALAPAVGLGIKGTAALAAGTEGALTMPFFTGEIDPTQMAVGGVVGAGLGAGGARIGQYLTKKAAASAAKLASAPSKRIALSDTEVGNLKEVALWDKVGSKLKKALGEVGDEGKTKLNNLANEKYPGRDFIYLTPEERKLVVKEFDAWKKAKETSAEAIQHNSDVINRANKSDAAKALYKRVAEYNKVTGKSVPMVGPERDALVAGQDVYDILGKQKPVPKVKRPKAPTPTSEQASALEALQAEPSVASATSGFAEAGEAVKAAKAAAKGEKKGLRDLFQIAEAEAERALPFEKRIEVALTKVAQQTRQHFETIISSDMRNKKRAFEQLDKMRAEAVSLVRKGDFDLTGSLPKGKELPVEGMSVEQRTAISGGQSVTQPVVGDFEKTLVDLIDEQKVLLSEFDKLGKASVAKQVMNKLERAAERIDVGTPADIGEVNEALRTVLEKLKEGIK